MLTQHEREDTLPPVPALESARQELLVRYGILDTAPEAVFDDIARLAALICDTPMAAISLVDGDRQWFKASVGLDVGETPREQSFCAHAIATPDETFVVADATRDGRFIRNPLVTGGPNVRFYAGSPLQTPEGLGLGSLCVIDTKARTLSSDQLAGLEALSRLVMTQLDSRRGIDLLSKGFTERELASVSDKQFAERFRILFEHGTTGMALSTPEGILQQVNDSFASLVGRDPQALIGTNITRVGLPDDENAERQVLDQLRSGILETVTRERPFARPLSGLAWGRVSSWLVRSSDGEPGYLITQTEDVTERSVAERAFDQLQTASDVTISLNPDGLVTSWNRTSEQLFDYRSEEVLGRPFSTLVPAHALPHLARNDLGRPVEVSGVTRDGKPVPIELSIGRSTHHGVVSFTAIIRDISARKQTEQALRRKGELIGLLSDVAIEANQARSIDAAMQAALERICALGEWSVGHVLYPDGQSVLRSSGLWWIDDPARFAEFRTVSESLAYGNDGPGRALFEAGPVWATGDAIGSGIERVRVGRALGLRDGIAFPVRLGDEVVAVLEFFAEQRVDRSEDLVDVLSQVGTQLGRVVERIRATNRLTHQALHDTLTGLPNRTLLVETIKHTLGDPAAGDNGLCILFMDFDRFKVVNDSLGHARGDELLVQAAHRIQSVLRTGDTLARLGGDEFVAVCPMDNHAPSADSIAERIIEQFAESFSLGDEEAFVGISIGIAHGHIGDDPDELVRLADRAMYRAKDEGRNRFAVDRDRSNVQAAYRLDMDTALHRALVNDQFRLAFQPTIRMQDDTVDGFEALLRWVHPVRGVVPPAEFVPLLEEIGLIEPVGEWVLRQACAQLATWLSAHPGRDLSMAVNISGRQLRHARLVDTVASVLRDTGIPPALLTLEITESVSMQDSRLTTRRLQALRELGVRLAVDDFGTGYSSLDRLHSLPIDILKIDRSFIASIQDDQPRTAIVDAVMSMGHALDLTLLAEGIETPEQAAYIRDRGCQRGQGFLYSRPLTSLDAGEFLKSGR